MHEAKLLSSFAASSGHWEKICISTVSRSKFPDNENDMPDRTRRQRLARDHGRAQDTLHNAVPFASVVLGKVGPPSYEVRRAGPHR